MQVVFGRQVLARVPAVTGSDETGTEGLEGIEKCRDTGPKRLVRGCTGTKERYRRVNAGPHLRLEEVDCSVVRSAYYLPGRPRMNVRGLTIFS